MLTDGLRRTPVPPHRKLYPALETNTRALPEHVQRHITRDVEKRVASFSRFATVDAAIAPLPLTAPYNRRNWLALDPAHRLATLRTNITKQVTDRQIERLNRRLAKASTPSPIERTSSSTPAPASASAPASDPAPAPATHYVVPCALGCGRFLPAKSPRPVLVKCKTHTGKKSQPPAVNAGLDQMIAAFRASASAH